MTPNYGFYGGQYVFASEHRQRLYNRICQFTEKYGEPKGILFLPIVKIVTADASAVHKMLGYDWQDFEDAMLSYL